MKTIALKEKTFSLMRDLKVRENASSFDALIIKLVSQKQGVRESMFGSLKGKAKSFTSSERQKIWNDKYRD